MATAWTSLMLRLTPAQIDKVARMAQHLDTNTSDAIRRAIEAYDIPQRERTRRRAPLTDPKA